MKVTITHSIDIAEVRKKIKKISDDSLSPMVEQLNILNNAIALYEKQALSSEDFESLLDIFRRSLATVDSGLAQVQTLVKGLSSAESAIKGALNPPPTQQPAPQTIQQTVRPPHFRPSVAESPIEDDSTVNSDYDELSELDLYNADVED